MDMQFLMRLVILLIESNCPKYCGTIDITPHLLQITNISRNGKQSVGVKNTKIFSTKYFLSNDCLVLWLASSHRHVNINDMVK